MFFGQIFWEQKRLLFCQSFAFLRNLDLNQQTFHLFRDIYLFGETFIFSAVPPSPQLAMPLSVLTASLGKNLLPLYLMSGIPQICPYWSKSLKHPMLYKLALEVQTIFLHQSTWYLAIRLTAAIMKCSGPLSAPALFQGCVRQQGTMFWRFEISQSISCFFWSMVITWVNDNLQKWKYRPIKVEWLTIGQLVKFGGC